MTEWNPIETAPSDGKCIVWCETDDGEFQAILERDKLGNWIYEGLATYEHGFYIQPVLWHPLPPDPI